MGRGEVGGVVVDDDGDVARRLVEALLEAQAKLLEAVEDPLRATRVGVVVASREAE